ncbi:MAG: L-threonylcarbamoyladenylate synthase [Candidatus Aminicenantes bacterium]|nr:L-threonylcarbamoyladenylate synthase [Candidatus Aminicenantes bacterium]
MAVETRIIRIKPDRVGPDVIALIAGVLRKDGVMAYPTDTFYGLGASCFSKRAIQRIYRLKKRERAKPLSILVSDLGMVRSLAVGIPRLFWQLAEEFWPGPLTLVLKASSSLPEEILGPEGSVGIRLPALPWLRGLISKVAFPITGTSANISGEKEIENPEDVIASFSGMVDLIVDGGRTEGGLPSTVVDLASPDPVIVREGAVPRSILDGYLQERS